MGKLEFAFRVGIPALAGAIMLLASLLPWIIVPLRFPLSAWQLSLDIGWQVRFAVLNYGVLCAGCALYIWSIAFRAWKVRHQSVTALMDIRLARACTIAACLCAITLLIFIWQYLFVDMQMMSQLGRQEVQYLLTTQHFGYGVAAQLAPVTNPIQFDPAKLHARAILLLDLCGPGTLLPFASIILLLWARRFFPTLLLPQLEKRQSRSVLLIGAAFFLLLLGRAPLALAVQHQAEQDLATGTYTSALRWLDTAYILNPELDQLTTFHIERGQAWFFLHPTKMTVESYLYLASTYRAQQDYLSAYQTLMLAWHTGNHAAWVSDEIYATCVQLAGVSKPLNGITLSQRLNNEESALPWIVALLQADPKNVFGLYMAGRIAYDLHSYSQCNAYMQHLLIATPNMLVQSSAYTYMALSSAGQGDYLRERVLLFQAIALDPEYRNNTAREELSGLR
ncbi:MAG TPA: hypothetical protein VH593_16410 [Ktedonobacteraceae bacterium]